MLTLKLLRENPEFVIEKLKVKNFDAKEIVEKINVLDQNRRALQLELDTCLSEQKKKAAQIGGLMKEGRKEEAEAVKAEVAALKARSGEIEAKSQENNSELDSLVVLLPNLPCDMVPEGKGAEDNVVVKTNYASVVRHILVVLQDWSLHLWWRLCYDTPYSARGHQA